MFATDLPASLIRIFAFSFGAIWGSFFNVAIYRWPRELSVVSPPSHCPACGAPIPPWRNIPIVSWLLLRGKAACCGVRISPRYLMVEVLSGVLCLALAERLIIGSGPGAEMSHVALETLLYFALAGGLLVATFVDLEFMEIPDEVSLPLVWRPPCFATFPAPRTPRSARVPATSWCSSSSSGPTSDSRVAEAWARATPSC